MEGNDFTKEGQTSNSYDTFFAGKDLKRLLWPISDGILTRGGIGWVEFAPNDIQSLRQASRAAMGDRQPVVRARIARLAVSFRTMDDSRAQARWARDR
ncbi:hypothetical protein AB1N83_012293 [Pleurotus pulmonarius]